MFDILWQQRRDAVAGCITATIATESIAVTGAPGVGKTTLLKTIDEWSAPERDIIAEKGIMTMEHQKFLIIRCIDELTKTKKVYDRNAIVDGYVFYCLTEEYLMEKAEENSDREALALHSKNLKEFKSWFWLYITDYVRYIDATFNILFLLSSVSKDELKDRVLGRDRKRDNMNLMDVFIDRFEELALRTLIEIRALGVNVNLMEVYL